MDSTKSLLVDAISLNPQISAIPPEIEAGNVEYKLKLINPTPERFQQLATQLKWRLSEGHGEALYELGISDQGVLIGMTPSELKESLKTLERMADLLGAEVSIVRTRTVGGQARRLSRQLRSQRESRKLISNSERRAQTARDTSWKQDEQVSNLTTLDIPEESDVQDEALDSVEEVFQVAEVLIRKTQEDNQFIEIRIAFFGGTTVGKSTLLGVLSHGEYDNGNGKARLNLLRHRHEIATGRSSSISHSIIGFSPSGELLNASSHHSILFSTAPSSELHDAPSRSSSPSKSNRASALTAHDTSIIDAHIVENSAKILMLIDTCGHPKYLHTTLSSLTGYDPDYACLVVDGNSGSIDTNTREILGCAFVLKVPVFVIITKIDLCQASDDGKLRLRSTMESLVQLLMLPGSSRVPMVMEKEDDAIVGVKSFLTGRIIPIFLVSCVNSENCELLIKFLNLLPARGAHINDASESVNGVDKSMEEAEFSVEEVYAVPDVGTVVGGKLISGELHNECTLWLGPMDSKRGSFIPVQISSVHRQRTPVKAIKSGQSATLVVEDIERHELRKGMVLLSGVGEPLSCWEFEASLLVLYSPGDVKLPFFGGERAMAVNTRKRKSSTIFNQESSPSHDPETADVVELKRHCGSMHVGNVRQQVWIVSVVGAETPREPGYAVLTSGMRLKARIRFLRNAEYLRSGMRILYREESISSSSATKPTYGLKIVGEVVNVLLSSLSIKGK